jgi:hypothetical protein
VNGTCLHGLMKVEYLVLSFGLEQVQARVELLAALVDMADDLPLVLLDAFPDLFQEWDAVAGRVPRPKTEILF